VLFNHTQNSKLYLYTGHLVAQESEGEQALIPSDLMIYTVQQSQHINVQANLKLLTTNGMTPAQLQVPQSALDGMVRLVFSSHEFFTFMQICPMSALNMTERKRQRNNF